MGKQIFKQLVSSMTLVLICAIASAQIYFEIDELIISNFNLGENYSEFIEDHGDGPTLALYGTLTNVSENPHVLNSNMDEIVLKFKYNDEEYRTDEVVYFPGIGNILTLEPGKKLKVFSSSHIFLGTDLSTHPASDFRELLMRILPTLEIQYITDDLGLSITSTKINDVQLVQ